MAESGPSRVAAPYNSANRPRQNRRVIGGFSDFRQSTLQPGTSRFPVSTTTSCRLPDTVAAQIQEATDECGKLQSELVRRAIRYYISQNPDGIGAFAPESGRSRSRRSATYDPLEDF